MGPGNLGMRCCQHRFLAADRGQALLVLVSKSLEALLRR